MSNKKLLVVICISLHILQISCRGIGVQVNRDRGLFDHGDRNPLQATGISRLTGRTFSEKELNTIQGIAQILHPILRGRRSAYLSYRVKPSAFFGPRENVDASSNSEAAIRIFRALYKDLLVSPKSFMSYKMV